jgi:hypothetical protein
MKIGSINHILRSAAVITNHRTFVIVGSAAVIARLRENIPSRMILSDEVDIYAFDAPNVEDLSDLIDGSIGQDSSFHATFGYYADGVSPETSKMPSDWMDRASTKTLNRPVFWQSSRKKTTSHWRSWSLGAKKISAG